MLKSMSLTHEPSSKPQALAHTPREQALAEVGMSRGRGVTSRGGGVEGEARGDVRAVAQLLKTEMVLPCPEMVFDHRIKMTEMMLSCRYSQGCLALPHLRWSPILKLTLWACGTNASTLERERARAHRMCETE